MQGVWIPGSRFARPGMTSERQAHQPRKILNVEITRAIEREASAIQHERNDRRPYELAPHAVRNRRTGIGALDATALLMLAAHAERQHGEQHDPPDDEVD